MMGLRSIGRFNPGNDYDDHTQDLSPSYDQIWDAPRINDHKTAVSRYHLLLQSACLIVYVFMELYNCTMDVSRTCLST